MRVTFVIPTRQIAGGIRVVFEYANRLQARGHKVQIVYPLMPLSFGRSIFKYDGLKSRTLEFLANLKNRNRIKWFDIKAPVIPIPWLLERFIDDADIVIATAWPTAYFVNSVSNKKGKKVYFIQHYEVWTWSDVAEKVDKTYKFPLYKIVIANWLKDLLKEKFNEEVYALIPNGVNLEQFYNDNKIWNKEKRILMLYSGIEWKGLKDGIKAFEIARERHPTIKLVMFGADKDEGVPSYVEFHKGIWGEELRKLYCSCDIFVCPSWSEGWGLPPMEAMACKCAVVTTNVGGIPDYTIPNETALISPPKDPIFLANNIIKLLDNEDELKRISIAGYDYIKNFTWEKATDKLEAVLKKIVNESK